MRVCVCVCACASVWFVCVCVHVCVYAYSACSHIYFLCICILVCVLPSVHVSMQHMSNSCLHAYTGKVIFLMIVFTIRVAVRIV